MSDIKIINFLNFNSLNLYRWLLLIGHTHQILRNRLSHDQILFRYTKTAVPNIGGTLSYLFLKRTNEKKQFFSTVKLLNFLADFLTMNMNFQPSNLMAKAV